MTTADVVLEGLLQERFSCRAFLPDEVPDLTVERMFALAQRTASWCNSQAWQVATTRGAATERLRTDLLAHVTGGGALRSDFPAPAQYRGVYQQRRREAGFALYDSLGIEKADQQRRGLQMLENFRFFGAPHVAVIHSDVGLGTYGAVDCGGYVSSLLLAAQSLGVATVAQAAIAMYSDFVRSWFGIGDDRAVVCAVSFGYADADHPVNGFRTTRAAVTDAVTVVGQ